VARPRNKYEINLSKERRGERGREKKSGERAEGTLRAAQSRNA